MTNFRVFNDKKLAYTFSLQKKYSNQLALTASQQFCSHFPAGRLHFCTLLSERHLAKMKFRGNYIVEACSSDASCIGSCSPSLSMPVTATIISLLVRPSFVMTASPMYKNSSSTDMLPSPSPMTKVPSLLHRQKLRSLPRPLRPKWSLLSGRDSYREILWACWTEWMAMADSRKTTLAMPMHLADWLRTLVLYATNAVELQLACCQDAQPTHSLLALVQK